MAKLQYMSDLHLEFLDSHSLNTLTSSIIAGQKEIEADVLCLCGDIDVIRPSRVDTFKNFLQVLSPYYTDILHIAGNHEYYYPLAEDNYAKKYLNMLPTEVPNYTFLDNNLAVLTDGTIVAGTTLWFSHDHPNVYIYANWLNDFNQIKGGHDFIKGEHDAALEFLSVLQPETVDVLLTHHGVTPFVVGKYVNNEANIYYYTDISNELYRLKPKYVLHGHMHDVFEYSVGDTVVKTNPYGYHGATKQFSTRTYVEV